VDGETSVYEWTQDSVLLGYRQVTINRIQTKIPAFQIITVDRFFEHLKVNTNSFQTESTIVMVSRDDLTPQASIFVPAANDSLLGVGTSYQDYTARIITRTRSGDIENRIPFGILSYDIYQMPILCRSVKILQQDLPLHILVIIPFTTPPGGMSELAEISIGKTDTVTVPAGTFECEQVIVKLPEFEEVYLIEKLGARQVIQYFNKQSGRKLSLISHRIKN